MSTIRHASALALAISACAIAPGAQAARAYDSCTGFIDSLPATITSQGTWCLRHDLSTSVTSGTVITIATNNATIDCNDFKLGGLAGGAGTQAVGIGGNDIANPVVRNCNVRGFLKGTQFYSARGAVVESNRFDTLGEGGIFLAGSGFLVRGNTVSNVDNGSFVAGIETHGTGDILDNVVSGVTGSIQASGILAGSNLQGSVSGNTVRGVVGNGANFRGIRVAGGSQVSISDNLVMAGPIVSIVGIVCESSPLSRARGNRILNIATPLTGCRDDGNTP